MCSYKQYVWLRFCRAIEIHQSYYVVPALILLGIGAAACGEQQVLTTTRNLDRPGPLALACAAQINDSDQFTALSSSLCASNAQVDELGVHNVALYGFVANTSSGDVAIFQTNASGDKLLDLDSLNPGYGFIPIGSLPTDLKSSPDNCIVASANSGSCDISVIQVPEALQAAVSSNEASSSSAVSHVIPRTASGPLRSAPQEIVIVPSSIPVRQEGEACLSGHAYHAYVTFPRCNLIAEIDLSTGMILQGMMFDAKGDAYLTDNPVCPADCILRGEGQRISPEIRRDAGSSGNDSFSIPDQLISDQRILEQGVKDKGIPDQKETDGLDLDATAQNRESGPNDGVVGDVISHHDAPLNRDVSQTEDQNLQAEDQNLPSNDAASPVPWINTATGVLPFGLAITEQGDKLYVSSAGASFVTSIVVDLNTKTMQANPHKILLSGDARTTRIKLSPPTHSLGRFLYAVASDRSVRVISVDQEQEQECETNLDLDQLPQDIPLNKAKCFVVGEIDSPRRVSATGSGLSFGNRIPQDVIFVQSPPSDAGVPDAGPQAKPLNGVFAIVAVSDGTVYVVDVEDGHFITTDTKSLSALHLPHRFRNSIQGQTSGQPDAGVASIKSAGSGSIPVIISGNVPAENPKVDAGLPGQGVFIRAPGETVATDWPLVYEDRLVARWSGNLSATSQTLTLTEQGLDFCSTGILGRELTNSRPTRHGDILVLVGCKDDTECGLEQVCRKPVARQADYGLCLDRSRHDELYLKCKDFLAGDREFLITQATSDTLTLDVLPVPPRQPLKMPPSNCTRNEDCPPYYLCAVRDQVIGNQTILSKGQCFFPGCNTDDDCAQGNHCVQPLWFNPLSEDKINGSPKVCSPVPLPLDITQVSCDSDEDCHAKVEESMFCAHYPGLHNVCVRRSPCFEELLRYDVVMGRSFHVGSYRRSIADPTTKECRPDETQSPLLTDRVPIGWPNYPVVMGPECTVNELNPLELPQPNPCFELNKDGYWGYMDRVSNGITVTEMGPSIQVHYSNPDLWFSMGLSHLSTPNYGVNLVPSNLVDAGAPQSNRDAGIGASGENSDAGGLPSDTSSSSSSSSVITPPLPTRGLTIQLSVNSGFSSLRASLYTSAALPVWLLEGADGFVYLVDMGNKTSSTGTRGQVLRFGRATLEDTQSFLIK